MPTDNETFTVTIQASGKSAETLLAKLNYGAPVVVASQPDASVLAELEAIKVSIAALVQRFDVVRVKDESGPAPVPAPCPRLEVVETPVVEIACALLEPTEKLAGTKRRWSEAAAEEEEKVVASEAEEEEIEEEVEEEVVEEVVEETVDEEVEETVDEEVEETVDEEVEETVEEEVEEEVEETVEEVVEEEVEETVEEVVEEEVEETVEEVVEEEVEETVEEVVEEEVVEEEAEEEEEELELEDFEWRGGIYYKDQYNNIYTQDMDGEITDAIGTYDPKADKITFNKE